MAKRTREMIAALRTAEALVRDAEEVARALEWAHPRERFQPILDRVLRGKELLQQRLKEYERVEPTSRPMRALGDEVKEALKSNDPGLALIVNRDVGELNAADLKSIAEAMERVGEMEKALGDAILDLGGVLDDAERALQGKED